MERAHRAGQILGVVGGVTAITVVIAALRSALPVPNLAPIYLLAVMLCAVSWGWWPALASALLAFLAYNFFFVEPIHTLAIHDPQIWVELLIFMLVAAVTSNLAARERERREEARERAEESRMLYTISRALGSQPLDTALAEVARLLRTSLGLPGCGILVADDDGCLQAKVTDGELTGQPVDRPAEWLLAPPRGPDSRTRWIAVRPAPRDNALTSHRVALRAGDRVVGALWLAMPTGGLRPQAARLLAAIAEQLAAALERERLRRVAEETELLRRTDELRAALLSSVSHDLRTPLAAIKASAGSLLQHNVPWTEADRDGFAQTIDREANRLDRLVQNLLDMSRIEGGALHPRRDWYDLAELVREVLARLDPVLVDHPVRQEASGELPPVLIDYLMIDQVLTNLLENAAKYTPAGTPVEVTVTRSGSSLEVCVVDHGPGIPPDVAGRIFRKFERARPDGGPAGSGLGLAVSRGFVEAHGGRLEYHPTPGGGASFCFSVPLQSGPTCALSEADS